MSDAGVFLILGGGAALVAFVLAALFATSGRRYGAVLLLGVVLAAIWFGLALLTADTDPNHRDCSDCDYIWGRWWWPPLVALILGLNLTGWLAGATGGWLARRAVRAAA